MNGPPADGLHDLVAHLLELQASFKDLPLPAGKVDGSVVTEEVRGVQQIDVQGVAFDPLPAVEQPAQRPDALVYGHAAGVFDRRAGAHLVGHRTDPADPGGDVGRFGEGPAAQESLEEARRLVDLELHVGDPPVTHLYVHSPLALHPGQGADVKCTAKRAAMGHGLAPPWRSRRWRC